MDTRRPDSLNGSPAATGPDPMSNLMILCFSHLRWDFVHQRPQHLMTRFGHRAVVVFWEEEQLVRGLAEPRLARRSCLDSGTVIIVPELPEELTPQARTEALTVLLGDFLAHRHGPLVTWYYTPMMLPFSRHIKADCVVYDCMDELANFKFAPAELQNLESSLFDHADLVFTGGYSLYEAKRSRHPQVYPFPSSVERDHFAKALTAMTDPEDQAALSRPRLGFYGVIDERLDLDLLASVADARPDWSIIMVGPVIKIDPEQLPRSANIHYLGAKPYAQLPAYLGGWDVALMPFAINEATRFISPTKTPEYLAAGRPVVSTPIVDVVRHFGELEAVKIASGAAAFIIACEEALKLSASNTPWRDEIGLHLGSTSWDETTTQMWTLIAEKLVARPALDRIVSAVHWPARERSAYDVMVVGAGFAGAILAERLASQADKRVLVIDRRPHIAGNAYDRLDDAGNLIHQYGPHIFHTNSTEVVDYLSQFTDWRPYEHRVLASVDGHLVPIPINRTTINTLYGLDLTTDEQVAAFLAARAEPVPVIKTSEDVVVSAVGRELYEKFFRGYTRKQWGLDPSELDRSVTARVPTRTNCDDRYFADKFQAMPAQGYTRMFERMLDHPNIEVLLGVDYREAQAVFQYDHLVFSGPIDEFFGFRFGKLPYRSLRFEHETLDQERYQDVAVVNYPDPAVPFTRITEYKHFTGHCGKATSITREYPCADGDPYYPIPRDDNTALFKRYELLAKATEDVTFVGRLATYRYYNMDQITGQALATFRRRFASGTDSFESSAGSRGSNLPSVA